MRMAFPTLALGVLLLARVAGRCRAACRCSTIRRPHRERSRYERCLTLTKEQCAQCGRKRCGRLAHTAGGGAAALHCEALALTALHRYGDAAVKLDQAAIIAPSGQRDLRIALYDQAGNAWLLAGNPEKSGGLDRYGR